MQIFLDSLHEKIAPDWKKKQNYWYNPKGNVDKFESCLLLQMKCLALPAMMHELFFS